jgi:hypothetical protein
MDYLLGLFSSSTIFQVRARWITAGGGEVLNDEKHNESDFFLFVQFLPTFLEIKI